ncbi:hypothetical protein ACLOJK_024334, partial [Asimina triloba]
TRIRSISSKASSCRPFCRIHQQVRPISSRSSHLPSITPKLPPIRPWPACVASFHQPFHPSFQIRTNLAWPDHSS